MCRDGAQLREETAMPMVSGRWSGIRVLFVVSAVLSMTTGLAVAEDVNEGQILRALTPEAKPLTRGLSMAPPNDPAASVAEGFVSSLRNRPAHSLSSGEREQIAEIARTKPNIDLEITFNYNSAKISTKAQPAVEALGRALSSPALQSTTFVIAGHTDGAGNRTSNQDLSERRADSIKRILVEKYKIPASNLVTVGYGDSKLKDTSSPKNPANRRVQVVNMANKTASN
jgi:outer membrane protein OmpA-like peptidoglycan-associated protein